MLQKEDKTLRHLQSCARRFFLPQIDVSLAPFLRNRSVKPQFTRRGQGFLRNINNLEPMSPPFFGEKWGGQKVG